MTVTLGNIECILYNILSTSACMGLKPFQTGTPFCGGHLRDIFGLQAAYFGPKKIDNDHIMTFGPFLQVAPDKRFTVGTYILPRKETLLRAHKGETDQESVNPYLLSYLQMLLTKKGHSHEILSVFDLLLNWPEPGVDEKFGVETDKCLRERKSRFYNMFTDAQVFEKAASCVSVPIIKEDGVEVDTPLSEQPFMLAFCGVHIPPAKYSYSKEFVAQTAVSNVALTDNGYFALKTLEHLDILIQTGSLTDPSNHNLILHHQRLKTSQDVTVMNLEYNTLAGNCAYKKPFQTFTHIRSGESTCPINKGLVT